MTSGLVVHKSRVQSESGGFFHNHANKPSETRSGPTWLREAALSVGDDTFAKISDSQKRCSGVEFIIQLIDDVTSPSKQTDIPTFTQSLRQTIISYKSFSFAKSLDLDELESSMRDAKSIESAVKIARFTLLKAFMDHAEFLDLFTPHLTRVPRDADGRLISNKDAGCSPPWDLDSSSRMSKADRESCLKELDSTGMALIQNLMPESEIDSVRSLLRIKTSYGLNSKPFETRETVPDDIFEGDRSRDVSYTQLASGRFAYQLRCSALEPVVKDIHRSVMPIVWEYLYAQRKDTLLTQMTGEYSDPRKSVGRVFLSSVSLVCADPLAGKDSWHATNGAGGVVVIVPLTPYEEKSGSLVLLPGSHKSWSWPRGVLEAISKILEFGGPAECIADIGDVFVMDGRVMRKNIANEKFNKSKIFLAFHYDFTDQPPPYQWLTTTLAQNAIAHFMERIARIYPKVPQIY